MLVLNQTGLFVRPLPFGTVLVVMDMFSVVCMMRAARHHVPDMVHELQPHHQRPCRQQRHSGKTRWNGNVMGSKHRDKTTVSGRVLAQVEGELWNFKAWRK